MAVPVSPDVAHLERWILNHAIATRYTRATREAFERNVRPVTDQEWNRAKALAQHTVRRTEALHGYSPDMRIGVALEGVVGGKGDVRVMVVVHGRDAVGHTATTRVTVTMARSQTVGDIEARAIEAARLQESPKGIDWQETEIVRLDKVVEGHDEEQEDA